jgi:hypothetical protein
MRAHEKSVIHTIAPLATYILSSLFHRFRNRAPSRDEARLVACGTCKETPSVFFHHSDQDFQFRFNSGIGIHSSCFLTPYLVACVKALRGSCVWLLHSIGYPVFVNLDEAAAACYTGYKHLKICSPRDFPRLSSDQNMSMEVVRL